MIIMPVYLNESMTREPHGTETESIGQHNERTGFCGQMLSGIGKVLDAGCNSGFFADDLKDAEYYGIDDDPVLIEMAKRKGLNVRLGDIKSLPFDDDFFNGVFCGEMIEHVSVEEAGNVLRELRRVIKDDGVMYLTSPLAMGDGDRINKLAYGHKCPFLEYLWKHHAAEYDCYDLRTVLLTYGFRVTDVWFWSKRRKLDMSKASLRWTQILKCYPLLRKSLKAGEFENVNLHFL